MPALLGIGDYASLGPHRRVAAVDLAALAGLVVLLAFLWGRAREVLFWTDEGISVGISSHAFGSIPDLLRQDGSPPLYYLLLNVWMSLFGSSEAATHILSLGFALATVPAALWAGWSLFGRRAGWICASLMALNPFLSYYANETRMYTLVVLLGLLATATFVHAFVFRRRRYLPAFTASLTLLIYTHNWGLLFGIAAGASVLLCALLAESRLAVIRDAAPAFGGAVVAYLPWLPYLLDQMAHVGAAFAPRPTPVVARDDVLLLFGLREASVVLGLGAAMGLAALLRWPWSRAACTIVAVALVPGVVLAAGWLLSRQESVWQARYLAVVVAPLALVIAVGLARGGQVAVACLAVYALFMVPIGVKQGPTLKSGVKLVADRFGPKLQQGDLVVTDFGGVPLLSYYLPPGLRYAEALGEVADERRSNQRDGTARQRAADPTKTLPPLVESLRIGGRVLVVCPPLENLPIGPTEFVMLRILRCDEALGVLLEMPGLRLVDKLKIGPPPTTFYGTVETHLFTKLPPS